MSHTGVRISPSGYDITPLAAERVRASWPRSSTPRRTAITQKAGTERPFCGNLLDNNKDGRVRLRRLRPAAVLDPSTSSTPGTGWPSFYREFDPEHVARKRDLVATAWCAPRSTARAAAPTSATSSTTARSRPASATASTRRRWSSTRRDSRLPAESQPGERSRSAYFAGGCFWGIEHYFQQGPGVIDAVSGYMQGHVDNPTYKQVCSDTTGHAETVKVAFDPKRITYRRLLEAFFDMHDPTELDRQGPDVGIAVPLRHLDRERRAAARGRGVHQGAAGPGRFGGRQDRHRRSSRRRRSGPPRTTTRTTSPRPARACHVDIAGALAAAGVSR